MHWLLSYTRIPDLSTLIGMNAFAALFGLRPHPFVANASAVQNATRFVLHLELFRENSFLIVKSFPVY